MTDKDRELEAIKTDEAKRRERLEQVNYQLFSEELIGQNIGNRATPQ